MYQVTLLALIVSMKVKTMLKIKNKMKSVNLLVFKVVPE